MGRTLFAEESLQVYVEKCYQSNKWSTGCIIGQNMVAQKDYAVHLVKTPGIHGDSSDVKKPKLVTLETLDDFLITTHAKQVLRMLPGGLEIIGIFICAPPAMMQTSQSKIKQMLYAVERTITKCSTLVASTEADDKTERYVMQMCPSTRKVTCRTFDMADNKSGARPAELKFSTISENWQELNSTFSLDFPFHIPTQLTSTQLTKQIQSGLSPLIKSIQSAVLTIDDQLMTDDEPLDSTASNTADKGKKSRKQKTNAQTQSPSHKVQMFLEMDGYDKSSELKIVDCGAKMLLRGTIESRAYVHSRATVKQAAMALQSDVIRSLLSRVQLLCEDLLQAEEEQDPRVLYELPTRVFASLAGGRPLLCDYMFQDEVADDAAARFVEILDLPVLADDLMMDLERIPREDELSKPGLSGQQRRHSSHIQAQSNTLLVKNIIIKYIGAAVGGVVAISSALAYIHLGEN